MLTWKRNAEGTYESSTIDKGKPAYKIVRLTNQKPIWKVLVHGCMEQEFKALSAAKRYAEKLECRKFENYCTDEDKGLANAAYAPGQILGCSITSDRSGKLSYVNKGGDGIVTETRYPDGRTIFEYGVW